MSSGDFEVELRQSVADNLALIANAAKAAKARIGQSVAGVTPPPPQEPADFTGPRPAVNFDAEEAPFDKEPALPDEPSFTEELEAPPEVAEPGLPQGAIAFDTYTGTDDEGVPVWEDPP